MTGQLPDLSCEGAENGLGDVLAAEHAATERLTGDAEDAHRALGGADRGATGTAVEDLAPEVRKSISNKWAKT